MRILYLISYAGRAGTEKYVEDLMRTFSARGHDCRLAVWREGPLSVKMAGEGFLVLPLDMSPRHVLHSAAALARYCRDNGIDIVHAQYPRENVIAVLSRLQRWKTRVVFTSHLTISQPLLWQLCNRLLTPLDHAVVAVCSSGVALLRKNGVCDRRIRYIPNGVETAALPPKQNVILEEAGLAPETFVFLIFARYVPEKGLNVLLQALAILRNLTDRPFACFIAGEGPQFEDVHRGISELGLSDIVIQGGFRPDSDALLLSANAYVSASVSSEAMSYSLLEAMRSALPIVATDVGAGRELAGDCGYVVRPGDARELAAAMLRLLSDPVQAKRLGICARERVLTQFDLRVTAERLMEIYCAQ